MGHHTGEFDTGCFVQHPTDIEQARQGGEGQACAPAAAVDLDEDGEGVAIDGRRRDGVRHGQVVGDDMQVHALAAQLGDGS